MILLMPCLIPYLSLQCSVEKIMAAGADYSYQQQYFLQSYTKPCEVALFLRRTLLRIIPKSFWGSKRNFAVICRGIHQIVNMRRY